MEGRKGGEGRKRRGKAGEARRSIRDAQSLHFSP